MAKNGKVPDNFVVLSLFDGISCGQQALKELNIKPSKYYASEIHLPSIKVTKKNFPDTILLGDVKSVKAERLPKIDLLLAGSPCQGFSSTGKKLNFNDPRSKLFFEFIRILKECRIKNPKLKFLLENVCMKKQWEYIISKQVGVMPIKINAALVSAQSRNRLYWTNIPNIKQPKDKKIYLIDIVDPPYCKNFKTKRKATDSSHYNRHEDVKNLNNSKAHCLTASMSITKLPKIPIDFKTYRPITVIEAERLQGLPDNYTAGISKTQRFQAIGNGWNISVIKHILKNL